LLTVCLDLAGVPVTSISDHHSRRLGDTIPLKVLEGAIEHQAELPEVSRLEHDLRGLRG
jgi:hypothetical protein